MCAILKDIVNGGKPYLLHSHTQFCDGHASMEEMAAAAAKANIAFYGFSPHSPVPIESPCNMEKEAVEAYLAEADRLHYLYSGKMELLAGMEIDRISDDWGPHIDYFQHLPLDYRIGSVHFVPNQDGVPIDCDGSAERFLRNLKDGFRNDLRYVVERYFEEVLRMLERGGFDILGHPDKIAANASEACGSIEEEGWYGALMEDVISQASSSGVIMEINTKAYDTKKRFFPAERWWKRIKLSGIPVAFNSDAHYPDKITSGIYTAIEIYENIPPSPSDSHKSVTHSLK